ncbi:MAG: YeeE/YedE thiosulfate transporter family protein [Sphingomonas sp.]
MIESAGFALALLCAVVMGYGVQRGATCAVSAMDEIVSKRRAHKLLAIIEAGLWVAGGLLVLRLLGVTMATPKGYAIGISTVAGGMLLGLGALVNRACVFGTVARIGSGEWVYLLTPIGFLAGCFVAVPYAMPFRTDAVSPVLSASLYLLIPFAALALWRAWRAWRAARSGELARHIWSPHEATVVIGIAFVVMLITVGAWAYTDALADFAMGRIGGLNPRMILLAGLFSGSILAGWIGGQIRHQAPSLRVAVRCLIGGALLGAGGVLVPGSNDGLLLLGIPLLQPHAWLAFGVMMTAIWVGLMATRRPA